VRSLEDVAEIGIKLKDTPRRGWTLRGLREPESVAEHSFCLALMSLVEADERGLDPCKAAALALIHDLPESVIGDLTPEEKARMGEEKCRELEDESLRAIAERLPPTAAAFILELFEEYRESKSPEARLVQQLDKLEMAVQAVKYASRGLPHKEVREFLTSAKNGIMDEKLVEIVDGLASRIEKKTG